MAAETRTALSVTQIPGAQPEVGPLRAPENPGRALPKNAICSVSTVSTLAASVGKLVMSASIIGWRRSSVEPTW